MSSGLFKSNIMYAPLGDEGCNMYYGASTKLFDLAEELRANMTSAELILWDIIMVNEWHLKFRRQHPISNYIADFYCHQIKLVIELDGGYHENKEVEIYDAAREKEINELGINIIRFKNEEVLNQLENVKKKIDAVVADLKNAEIQKSISANNSPSGDGGKLFIIKIGGNILDDANAQQKFLKLFAAVPAKKILVHGGGKIATTIGKQLGIEPNYVDGRRITDAATIDLVTMVYAGLINKKLVAALQSLSNNAIGLSGADANIIPAIKRPVKNIDYGFVGDVNNGINSIFLKLLIDKNLVPVIAPLTHDGKGQILNTNADTIASALAVSLSKQFEVRLIYCFEKKGVLENMEDENSVINHLNKNVYKRLLSENKLADGILPKIENAFAAIDNGVQEVLIGDANDLLLNISENVKGTLIK